MQNKKILHSGLNVGLATLLSEDEYRPVCRREFENLVTVLVFVVEVQSIVPILTI